MSLLHTIIVITFLSLVLSINSAAQSPAEGSLTSIASAREAGQWFFLNDGMRRSPLALENDRQSLTGDNINLLARSEILSVATSSNGRYFSVITAAESDPAGKRHYPIWLYQAEGSLQYRINYPARIDEAYPLLSLNGADGSLVLGRAATGELWVYDSSGSMLLHEVLFPDVKFNLERILRLDHSGDGKSLAVVASRQSSAPQGQSAPFTSGEAHLFKFDHRGNPIFQLPLPGDQADALQINEDGSLVAVSSYAVLPGNKVHNQTTLFGNRGQQLRQFPLLARQIAFAVDKPLLLLSAKRSVLLADVNSGQTLWTLAPAEKSHLVCAGQLSQSGQTAVVLTARNDYRNNRFQFSDPRLNLYDTSTNLESVIHPGREIFLQPSIEIDENAGQLLIGFIDKLQMMRLP